MPKQQANKVPKIQAKYHIFYTPYAIDFLHNLLRGVNFTLRGAHNPHVLMYTPVVALRAP